MSGSARTTVQFDEAVVRGLKTAFDSMSERYAIELLVAERHQRTSGRRGHRSGSRAMRRSTPFGTIEVDVVKSRTGNFTATVTRWVSLIRNRPSSITRTPYRVTPVPSSIGAVEGQALSRVRADNARWLAVVGRVKKDSSNRPPLLNRLSLGKAGTVRSKAQAGRVV